eukprot:CAMPEP_0113647716 /NCGR_PEP_ID=MMETSP0017_2-20120614/25277_1 /TAXON_ID=2856 /ORGANISM="Cylindrotheca closterium" /LENGTH=1482 /DNA_ID=CAMNT_0000559827 /DNA_START=29 /DNA_END=4477 /DNA_ORIENTATION=+ /assembly_acc=CAM_ASM_000147
MGKSNKKGKGASADKGKNSNAPKCTCDHPFNCACGNRPPRPSRGHKWDPETQQWGGKGHKQKGASGQVSSAGKQAQTTAVGQTNVAQWQKLPSTILRDYCQKQRRPPPKFKELLNDHTKTNFKVRVIVPDGKDSNKDLILRPARPVGNEEQAREEASLLALLQLTPSLPHERKLPEPYKTTWLAAVQAQKDAQESRNNMPKGNRGGDSKPAASTTGSGGKGNNKASSNTNLALGSTFTSHADRRKRQEEKKRQRNARIRKHEAIRMANRNHPVFLSATLRQQIQRLLKGDTNLMLEDSADDAPLEPYQSDRQGYVEERLHQEGFTKRQARKAFEEQSKTKKHANDSDDEELWERLYDDCLQWLCIHLDEDQLPEGFDPRGATLEIVSNASVTKTATGSTAKADAPAVSPELQQFAKNHGLVEQDLALIAKSATGKSLEDALWTKVCELAEVNLADGDSCADADENKQMFEEEMEAMEAIFPSDCTVTSANGLSNIVIKTPEELVLTLVVPSEQYPSVFPQKVIVTGNWPSKVGLSFTVELVKFVSTLSLGEPMLFEIYGQIQLLFQTLDELPVVSLSPQGDSAAQTKQSTQSKGTASKPSNGKQFTPKHRMHKVQKRPRARGEFWSTLPAKAPPATAFPKIDKDLHNIRAQLPAGKARGDFLERVKEAESLSRVVLVTGDTGCGKTTQIPQFILENAPRESKIVVAQPRRLAATGVAARVAQERGEGKVGTGSVGYVVRGDSAYCKNTRLLFCTFGILLRQLQCKGALDCITHVVLDEVHERNLDCDVLMALLRKALSSSPNLRVILMSATLDADRFAAYWGDKTPRMHIPGRTFPVEDYFLENVLDLTGYIPPKKKKKRYFYSNSQPRQRKSTPWNDSEMSDPEDQEEEEGKEASKSTGNFGGNVPPLEERVKRVDESSVDYDMLGQLVRYLIQKNIMGRGGSILVFLPGAPEINQAKAVVGKITGGLNVSLLPLHGGLQPKDQNAVFRSYGGVTKVILSTNVAETSITIPDCTVVIDSCREKQSTYDPANRMPMLIEHFASKASLKQRRGRAGRVRSGKCYKLISKETHAKLRDHTAPEITRCALDQTLLSLMFLGVERGNGSFIKTLLDPPAQESLDAAIFSLWKVGALEHSSNNDELDLTPLGMHLAGIPAPPVVGKMLIMGSILGCRRAALAMASAISAGRSPFLKIDLRGKQDTPDYAKQQRVLEERAKLFERSGNSDHAMLATAFIEWEGLRTGGGERKRYCESVGLSFNGMRDILQLVNQYDSSLRAAGYGRSAESDCNAHSYRILRTCAISSMAPGQLVRLHRPSTKYADTAEGAREKDGVAREMKFFVRNQEATLVPWKSKSNDDSSQKEERVFIHPSSALFSVGNYNCPWLVYHSMVKTSKPFLRDATECSAYALLLFGGQLDVQARNDTIVIDNWVKLSANARIGALIHGLRSRMDDLLEQKINDPNILISETPEMRLIVKLLITDGLGS